MARTEIYGSAETNVNRKIVPLSEISSFARQRTSLNTISRLIPSIPMENDQDRINPQLSPSLLKSAFAFVENLPNRTMIQGSVAFHRRENRCKLLFGPTYSSRRTSSGFRPRIRWLAIHPVTTVRAAVPANPATVHPHRK
jgi:hypothetical protein